MHSILKQYNTCYNRCYPDSICPNNVSPNNVCLNNVCLNNVCLNNVCLNNVCTTFVLTTFVLTTFVLWSNGQIWHMVRFVKGLSSGMCLLTGCYGAHKMSSLALNVIKLFFYYSTNCNIKLERFYQDKHLKPSLT